MNLASYAIVLLTILQLSLSLLTSSGGKSLLWRTVPKKQALQTSSSNEDESDLTEATITVQGQSFGGYFRAHARNEAFFMRRLCGALQEYPDRTEIVVEGKRSAIESFVKWCKRGPGLTQTISIVDVSFAPYTGIFDSFRVIPDSSPIDSVSKNAGVP